MREREVAAARALNWLRKYVSCREIRLPLSMPMTKQTRLAQARRLLRRLEDDEPLMRLRIAEYSTEQQEVIVKSYANEVEKQRACIRQLESELDR